MSVIDDIDDLTHEEIRDLLDRLDDDQIIDEVCHREIPFNEIYGGRLEDLAREIYSAMRDQDDVLPALRELIWMLIGRLM